MKFEPKIGLKLDENFYDYKLFESLEALSKTFSQRKTAEILDVSAPVLNRRIKNVEKKLGYELTQTTPKGTELSKNGLNLLNKYINYKKKLEEFDNIKIFGGPIVLGLLEYLSIDFKESHLEEEKKKEEKCSTNLNISLYSSDNSSAYEMFKRNFVDILALDDPLLAFQKDLEFIPIASDTLSLVSNNNINLKKIKSVEDLKNLKFISVEGSAQRLAWQTLKDLNIPFSIVKEVKSQYDAYKIVSNSENIYTFLNTSFFKGDEILKNQTEHVLSLIIKNKENSKVNNFIDYILNNGKKIIKEQGFLQLKSY
ncbi:LysR family transcriptional regulator [Methanobrevibacter curvatus]|uniref:DNA-binding transcriptional regulator IlvY n=1 Tax=Methanobrevibacter curvatus TaxID=49547 RepID=A0A166A2X9_9EURY|nr:LysR family transcriptional regulator [Methanobrevibacter curvatus]KZX11493.1 DNA-binding transcriptional regulator IlvY [Methanobrevibacter curvatus]